MPPVTWRPRMTTTSQNVSQTPGAVPSGSESRVQGGRMALTPPGTWCHAHTTIPSATLSCFGYYPMVSHGTHPTSASSHRDEEDFPSCLARPCHHGAIAHPAMSEHPSPADAMSIPLPPGEVAGIKIVLPFEAPAFVHSGSPVHRIFCCSPGRPVSW